MPALLKYICISEKQRIPSWTDRILYKGDQLELSQYSRAELFTSDHRPGMLFSQKYTFSF